MKDQNTNCKKFGKLRKISFIDIFPAMAHSSLKKTTFAIIARQQWYAQNLSVIMIQVFTCTSVLHLWTANFNREENWYSSFLCNMTYHSSPFVSAKIKTNLGDTKKLFCKCLFCYVCFQIEFKTILADDNYNASVC